MSNLITVNHSNFFSGGNKQYWELNEETGLLETNADNATLKKDDWILLTSRMIKEYQKNTVLINDLRSAGLTSSLGGLGTIIAEWQREGDITEAVIDMDARTEAQKDRPEYDLQGVPVPITHKSYHVHTRHELASRRGGADMARSVRSGILASIKVAQSNEQMLLNGVPGLKVQNNEVFGYRTHPDRIQGTLSANWAVAGGDAIIADALSITGTFRSDLIEGQLTFYVAEDIWTNLQNDYSANKGSNTIYDRLQQIAQIATIKPARYLADGEVIAITLDAMTVNLGIAQDTSNVQWNDISLFETEYKVFNALVPMLLPTMAGRLGVAHFVKP